MELKDYDLSNLEERHIHECLKMHNLDNESILNLYAVEPTKRQNIN
jgi:hypothetical protein